MNKTVDLNNNNNTNNIESLADADSNDIGDYNSLTSTNKLDIDKLDPEGTRTDDLALSPTESGAQTNRYKNNILNYYFNHKEEMSLEEVQNDARLNMNKENLNLDYNDPQVNRLNYNNNINNNNQVYYNANANSLLDNTLVTNDEFYNQLRRASLTGGNFNNFNNTSNFNYSPSRNSQTQSGYRKLPQTLPPLPNEINNYENFNLANQIRNNSNLYIDNNNNNNNRNVLNGYPSRQIEGLSSGKKNISLILN